MTTRLPLFRHRFCFSGLVVAASIVMAVSGHAQEPDADGSRDHPAFSRLPGFYINTYEHQEFSVFELSLDPIKTVEGEYWSIQYVLNDGAKKPGPLQIGRNYTNLIRQREGTLLVEDLDSSGGTTVARLPVRGGGYLWLEVRVNNGGEVYTLDIVQEAVMTQEVAFTASSLVAALMTDGTVPIRSIFFANGQATIQPSSVDTLNVIIEMLKANTDLKLEIQGHTDNVGRSAANLSLSSARAAAVKTYLVKNGGISDTRLTTSGFGDSRPVADNATEAGRLQNRRVELVKR